MSDAQSEAGRIVAARIHPSIGIARVGNSEDGWFLGPEVTDPRPCEPGFYRDQKGPTKGALKRQAARFRVYGLDAEGKIVAELNAGSAKIKWSVHLANKKAAWYQFQLALDIPEAASAPATMLRNSTITDRAKLAIDPGPRQICGANVAGGKEHVFDSGEFMGTAVYLGEIRTDEKGRLVVLGGRGKSASYNGALAVTFANNEGWHDDVSDGPVTAQVEFDGRTLTADPAWIVVAPPNYGPTQKSVRTMWDLMRDLAISSSILKAPDRPSFNDDIRPIFQRLSDLQWVNAGFASSFGFGSPNNFTRDDMMRRLGSGENGDALLRQGLLNQFRSFDRDAWSPVPWPWMYGDAMNLPTPQTSRAFVSLTTTQLKMLKQWGDGDFEADYRPDVEPPRCIEDVPIVRQGEMLDRAALDFCLADAFHPGCEITWVARALTLYAAPFRFLHAPPDWTEPDYGPQISPDMANPPSGPPFTGQLAGGITRWMAVPWQADTASCRSNYGDDQGDSYGHYLPTFWPARVPNHVLSRSDYEVVMNGGADRDARLAAFAHRSDWLWPIKRAGNYIKQINGYIADISKTSIVETVDGPSNDPDLPAVMEVEDIDIDRQPLAGVVAALTAGAQPEHDLSGIDKVRRFPHGLKKLV